jgi:hypothetical protein
MSELNEYYVTLHNFEEAEEFYNDMETEGGSLYIPGRCVECANRRPISRTTHYMLTAEEAELIKKDPRVLDVELNYADAGVKIMPLAAAVSQDGNKADITETVAPDMLNWGLVRHTVGRPNLGLEFYPDGWCDTTKLDAFNTKADSWPTPPFKVTTWQLRPYTRENGTWQILPRYWDIVGVTPKSGKSWGDYGGFYNTTVNTTVRTNATGKNVDVVIIDGGIVQQAHPEFAKNPDGSGGTRCVSYNWYQHNTELGLGANGTYPYSGSGNSMFGGIGAFKPVISFNSHATHCTGTVAGITQGWAKEANIYNLDFNQPNVFDFVRMFHKYKPINPATGRKNPTVCSNSWGLFVGAMDAARISSYTYRGTVGNSKDTGTLNSVGILADEAYGSKTVGIYSAAMDSDVQDAINEGIIIICASGNSSYRIARADSPDWDNTVTITGAKPRSDLAGEGTHYYARGASPGSSTNNDARLCIGALYNLMWDTKASFSNCGPQVELYAAGQAVMSSYLNETATNPAVKDSRNNSYYLQKLQGTSMATPQVSGIIACLLETYPHWSNKEVKEYLIATSEKGAIKNTPDYNSYYNLAVQPFHTFSMLDSPNQVVMLKKQRPDTGAVWPHNEPGVRNPKDSVGTQRSVYPRRALRRK